MTLSVQNPVFGKKNVKPDFRRRTAQVNSERYFAGDSHARSEGLAKGLREIGILAAR